MTPITQKPPPEHPVDDDPPGFGPVMTADDGTKFRATEDDMYAALPLTAALIIAMVTHDLASHAEWTAGGHFYYFSKTLRVMIRIAGYGISGLIVLAAWRDAKRQQREHEEDAREASEREEREIAGRKFVPGKRPGWDHE